MDSLKRKQKQTFTILISAFILLLLIIAGIKRTEIFHSILSPFDFYTSIVFKVTQLIHSIFGLEYTIVNNTIVFESIPDLIIDSGILLKKWVLVIFALILSTPLNAKSKAKAIIVFIAIHFGIVVLNAVNFVFLYYKGVYEINAGYISKSLSYYLFLVFITQWIKNNPQLLEKISTITKTKLDYLKTKIKSLTIIIYVFIGIKLLVGTLEFEAWINFLFTTTHHILSFLGYNSTVIPFYLLGDNANIYMAKGCLGIMTSYIFASFIALTGEKLRLKTIYILVGLLIINIANILRFVFLFIHLQEQGEYLWKMEVHDLFNVIIYGIVFAMWIIWLEYFSDIWPYLKKYSTTPTASKQQN